MIANPPDGSSTDPPSNDAPLLPERIEQWARRTPGGIAVISGSGARVTYAELFRMAGTLAAELAERGVRRGDIVGVSLARTPWLVAALLAVWRRGAAYLPLDPSYPAQRLEFMVRDAGVSTVIAESASAKVAAGAAGCVLVDGALSGAPSTSSGPVRPPAGPVAAKPADIAYVIYTSGSTGPPKGVLVSHANLRAMFSGTRAALGIPDSAVWSCAHSVSFDFSVWEIWGGLGSGGGVILLDEIQMRSPRDIAALLDAHRVNILSQTPSAFRHLMPVLLETGIPASLSTIVLGGEAIEATEFATWLERYPGAALHNLYGITEATVHTTVKTLTEAALAAGVASPIGRPLPGVQLAVIRDDGGLAVPGDEGELMIGGAGVAQGYLNRPELTAGRFVTQNLPGHSADRWYRTGDRAFELPNGEFAYRGRLDRQVKLRGYRIELGEIEAALLRHPGIAAAAVEMDEPAGHSLVAYIVAAGQAAGPRRDEELREHLRGTLPDYMIPRVFMALPAMPLTANGKVDVARLPPTGPPAGPAGAAAERPLAGQPTGAGGAGPEDRPRPGTETIVATIWQASLGTAIRRSDSFFAKGGDSMSALEVVAAVDALGLPASVQGLYAAPRLADFAASLEQQPVGVPAPDDDWHHFRLAAGAQVPSSATDAYPITRTQLGLLYEGSRSPLTPLYHVTSGVHLVGLVPAAVDDFPGAVQSVARAHPALRTGMQLHRAGGHQIVYSSVDVRTTAIDVRGEREERQRAAFERWLKDKAGEPFDPEDVPLWRVAFFRTGDDRGYLGVVHHHAILDGWSVAVLFREFLSVLSGGQCDGEPAYALPRFAALEAAAAESAVSKRFWSDVVSRCRSSHDAPCRPSDGAKEHRITVTLHGQLRASLKATADSAGWWLKSVLLAAHITALRVIDPHTNATLMVASGRPEIPDAENVLGVFLNNLPFPVPSDSATTYAQLILHCMRQEADFSAHRRFPYADMPRSAGNQPLWSMFNFVDFTAVGLDEYRDRLPDNNRTDVPVTVSVTETALVVEVRCDGRAEELAEKFADGFLAALGQIVQDPHVSVMAGGEPGRVSADAVSREAPEDEPFRLPRGAVVPPATATEALLVDVWQRLLGMEVGTTDNFFAIGGDSLMALKVIALVREQTGFRLPVSAFVGDQDLASIAKILAENSQLAGR